MSEWCWPEPHLPPTGGYFVGPSLRDQFAMRVLPEIYSQLHEFPEGWRLGLAQDAYKMADAMLKAREQ